jgi:hypothetical protein
LGVDQVPLFGVAVRTVLDAFAEALENIAAVSASAEFDGRIGTGSASEVLTTTTGAQKTTEVEDDDDEG